MLSCSVDVTDPDGEEIEPQYNWNLPDGSTETGDSVTLGILDDRDKMRT